MRLGRFPEQSWKSPTCDGAGAVMTAICGFANVARLQLPRSSPGKGHGGSTHRPIVPSILGKRCTYSSVRGDASPRIERWNASTTWSRASIVARCVFAHVVPKSQVRQDGNHQTRPLSSQQSASCTVALAVIIQIKHAWPLSMRKLFRSSTTSISRSIGSSESTHHCTSTYLSQRGITPGLALVDFHDP